MVFLFYGLILFFLFGGLAWLFLSTPPARLARIFTSAGPISLVVIGAFLMVIGRGGIGIPIAAIGLGLWRRSRSVSRMSGTPTGNKSTVRTAAFEMELDHDTGEMDGRILIGAREGSMLAQLNESELMELYRDISADAESVALFEAYLDRRISGWRDNTQAHAGGWESEAPVSGSMTKQEAYQVLGLEPGASPADIKNAWRKLMKSVHPDSGGSEFLAAKINAAKDILLD